ncbi:MAG: hypothetical protein IJR40_01845, partial [Treponema sp.]|nr:hypothetical protein [Treponema sp.]
RHQRDFCQRRHSRRDKNSGGKSGGGFLDLQREIFIKPKIRRACGELWQDQKRRDCGDKYKCLGGTTWHKADLAARQLFARQQC